MKPKIELEQEEDGRWLAEVPALPGVMVYGPTREQAIAWVQALTLRVLVDRAVNESDGVPPIRPERG